LNGCMIGWLGDWLVGQLLRKCKNCVEFNIRIH